jgi:hypothetical protein
MKKFAVIVILIVLLSNFLPLENNVSYSNADGSFTFEEMNFKGRDYSMCFRKFDSYKKEHHDNTVLYRITPILPWKFWHWKSYLFQDKYKLPFKSWNEISASRGVVENKSGYQDF